MQVRHLIWLKCEFCIEIRVVTITNITASDLFIAWRAKLYLKPRKQKARLHKTVASDKKNAGMILSRNADYYVFSTWLCNY